GDSAAEVLVGCHAELRGSPLVKTAAGAVARVVHGPRYVIAGLKVALEQAQAAGIRVLARSNAERGFEAALQVERTLPKSPSQALKRDGFIKVLLDIAADLFRQVRLWISAERSRPATQAGAKAGLLRLLGTRIERHIIAPRTARRTRRPAIDTGGRDGKDELSVAGGIARDDGVPAIVLTKFRVGLRDWHFADEFLCEYGIRRH